MTGTELEVRDEFTPTLFGTSNPVEARDRMVEMAKTFVEVVRDQDLVVRIGQSDHVKVEGWTFLGSLVGVFGIVEWTRPVFDTEGVQIGWEARVEARTRTGEVVGAAESVCLRTESAWRNRDEYALKSMAQTRAMSKALRGPLGFIVKLAGFNPTPADEMVVEAEVVDEEPVAPFIEPGANPVVDYASAGRKRKLDVLVGKLRAADHDPTGWIYARFPVVAAVVPASENADRLHWAPLRDRLSNRDASELIDALEAIVKKLPS